MQLRILALFATLAFAEPMRAQPAASAASAPGLNVFLDCFQCDFD